MTNSNSMKSKDSLGSVAGMAVIPEASHDTMTESYKKIFRKGCSL